MLDVSGEFEVSPLSLKKPNGDRAFEVMGIPLKKAGFYLVEFASPRLGKALLGKDAPMYVPAGALVTNLSVHFKTGARVLARLGDDSGSRQAGPGRDGGRARLQGRAAGGGDDGRAGARAPARGPAGGL